MKTIPLTQGHVALVDDEDFEGLSRYNWHARKDKQTFYAARGTLRGGVARTIMMHVAISGIKNVDHIDGNGLNNQRSNLRPASASQQAANRKKSNRNSSKYKGVSWNKRLKKWMAQIKPPNKKQIYLGLFDNEELAARAYNQAAIEHFGDFAKLNQGV